MATQAALDAAGKLEDLPAREQALRAVVFAGGENEADAETVKVKEAAVGMLADALTRQAKAQALAQLLQDLRAFFAVIPKAKTAKLVRTVIDQIAKVPDSTELQVR
jgi:26S proteasome regulatory subunit N6